MQAAVDAPAKCPSLRQVVVVHRHGERLPTKVPGPGELLYPQDEKFWSRLGGELSPIGFRSMASFGAALRSHYSAVGGETLLGGSAGGRWDGQTVCAYSSPIQRALMSAWAMLLEFCDPAAGVHFQDARKAEQEKVDGVAIRIDEFMLREWTKPVPGAVSYKEWRKANMQRSPALQKLASRPDCIALADKLFSMTAYAKIRPDKDMIARLYAIKTINTQIQIAEVHDQKPLHNKDGLLLSDSERSLVGEISREVKRCWFQDSVYGRLDASLGRRGACTLAMQILRHLQARSDGSDSVRCVMFSCHDTTLSALANHLGIELPVIDFGAHFIFELHERAAESLHAFDGPVQAPVVRMIYNQRWKVDNFVQDTHTRVPPLGSLEQACLIDDLPRGEFALSDFVAHVLREPVDSSTVQGMSPKSRL